MSKTAMMCNCGADCQYDWKADHIIHDEARRIDERAKRLSKRESAGPNGILVYDGPSAIDGAPIVVIVTGLASRSTNRKTGGMLQSYIMRSDIEPTAAWSAGLDVSVCGDCVHRSKAGGGEGTCYVNKGQGPLAVFRAFKRGRYPVATLDDALHMVRGRAFRIRTYGDPGAVPDAGRFWARLTLLASERTGYTHRWRDVGANLRGLCMASVDSEAEAIEAQSLGWATFRVAPYGDHRRLRTEAYCPASEEAGRRVTCETCPLKCDGTLGGAWLFGRVIQAHGASKRRVR